MRTPLLVQTFMQDMRRYQQNITDIQNIVLTICNYCILIFHAYDNFHGIVMVYGVASGHIIVPDTDV